ncbi:unnamed protein product [Musa acuminata var. zebrina]
MMRVNESQGCCAPQRSMQGLEGCGPAIRSTREENDNAGENHFPLARCGRQGCLLQNQNSPVSPLNAFARARWDLPAGGPEPLYVWSPGHKTWTVEDTVPGHLDMIASLEGHFYDVS